MSICDIPYENRFTHKIQKFRLSMFMTKTLATFEPKIILYNRTDANIEPERSKKDQQRPVNFELGSI